MTCFLLLRFRCGQPCCKGTFSVGIQRCKWPSKHYSCWQRNNNLCHGKVSVAWDTNKFRIARRFQNFSCLHFELYKWKNLSLLFHPIKSKQVSTKCPLTWDFPPGRHRLVTLQLFLNSAGGNPAVEWYPVQGGVEILLVASYGRNWGKLLSWGIVRSSKGSENFTWKLTFAQTGVPLKWILGMKDSLLV